MAEPKVNDEHPMGWRAPGQWILLGVALLSGLLWLNAQSSVGAITGNWLLSAGKLAGVIGLTLYVLNILLASRLHIYERLFGSMNRVYWVHHTQGGLAFMLMLLHPILIILSRWKYPLLLRSYVWPSWAGLVDSGYTWGVLAIWMLILLLSITYWAKLPYQWWKRTHYFIGVPAFFLFLHVLLVPSDVQRSLPLKWWLLSLLILAVIARAYKFVWLRYIWRGYSYQIDSVNKLGLVTEVNASPLGRPLRYWPGQFVFVTYDDPSVPREEHPFSISTYSEDGKLRLSMKQSGDFTAKLPALHKGGNVHILGPYGIFGHSVYETHEKLVMVAGGIGITPLVSLLHWLSLHEPNRKVSFYYSVKNRAEAVYEKELKALAKQLPNLQLTVTESGKDGLLTGDKIFAGVKARYIICGPPPMQRALMGQLKEKGVNNFRIETELFSL